MGPRQASCCTCRIDGGVHCGGVLDGKEYIDIRKSKRPTGRQSLPFCRLLGLGWGTRTPAAQPPFQSLATHRGRDSTPNQTPIPSSITCQALTFSRPGPGPGPCPCSRPTQYLHLHTALAQKLPYPVNESLNSVSPLPLLLLVLPDHAPTTITTTTTSPPPSFRTLFYPRALHRRPHRRQPLNRNPSDATHSLVSSSSCYANINPDFQRRNPQLIAR